MCAEFVKRLTNRRWFYVPQEDDKYVWHETSPLKSLILLNEVWSYVSVLENGAYWHIQGLSCWQMCFPTPGGAWVCRQHALVQISACSWHWKLLSLGLLRKSVQRQTHLPPLSSGTIRQKAKSKLTLSLFLSVCVCVSQQKMAAVEPEDWTSTIGRQRASRPSIKLRHRTARINRAAAGGGSPPVPAVL